MPVSIARSLILLAVAAALVVPSLSSAAAPDGQYRFESDGMALVIGADADFNQFFGFGALCGKGRRKANGSYKRDCDFDIPGSGRADGVAKGKLERKDDKTVLKESLRIKGRASGGGQSVDFEYLWKIKVTQKDNKPNSRLAWTAEVCVNGRCEKDKDSSKFPSSVFFNDFVIATEWTLDLNVTTNADNSIGGSAVLETADGETINFNVKGTYDPSTDTSKIKLKNNQGAKIKLKDAVIDLANLMTAAFKVQVLGNITAFTKTSVPLP